MSLRESPITFKSNRMQEEKLFRKFRVVGEITSKAARHTFFTLARNVKRRANHEILKGLKTGRIYIYKAKSGRKRKHRASSGGDTAHANLSGALRRSMGWKVHGSREMTIGYGLTKDRALSRSKKRPRPYDKWIEFGTKKMDPRPSIGNAIDYVQADGESEWAREIHEEFAKL